MIDLDRAFLGALRACALEHDSKLKIITKVPYRPTIKRGSNNDAGTIICRSSSLGRAKNYRYQRYFVPYKIGIVSFHSRTTVSL
jgi:hypothetical protein